MEEAGRPSMMRRLLVVAVVVLAGLVACDPTPTDPGTAEPHLIVTRADLAALPANGPAWDRMKTAATKSWGTPTVGDQNSVDDTDTLAGALVAARLNDGAIAAKVRAHLVALTEAPGYDRVLGLARQLPSYVIAADLVGLTGPDETAFRAFLVEAKTHRMAGHSGGYDLVTTAMLSPNNWGTMARAALAAADLYLGDQQAELEQLAATQRAWLEGGTSQLKYSDTNWHVGAYGINPPGATIAGHGVDGVLPEDQRRTGEYYWPAPKGSYPWEALQGATLASVLLDRAGLLPFNTGTAALNRAATWLTVTNANPAAGDDQSTIWLLHHYAASSLPRAATRPGKNLAWADWWAA